MHPKCQEALVQLNGDIFLFYKSFRSAAKGAECESPLMAQRSILSRLRRSLTQCHIKSASFMSSRRSSKPY